MSHEFSRSRWNLRRFVLILGLGAFSVLALPRPAEAQFLKKIKEKAAEIVQKETAEVPDRPDVPTPAEAMPAGVEPDGSAATSAGEIDEGRARVEFLGRVNLGGRHAGTIFKTYMGSLAKGKMSGIRDLRFLVSQNGGAATVALDGSRFVVYHNGEAGPKVPKVEEIALSFDGEHVAYVVPEGERRRVFHDGEPGPLFHEIEQLQFGPSSSRLVYVGRRDDGPDGRSWHVVDDGEIGPAMTRFERLMFSKAGKLAYIGHVGTPQIAPERMNHLLYVDGHAPVTGARVSEFQFGPDGERFSYLHQSGKPGYDDYRGFVVVDGKRTRAPHPSCLVLGPGGRASYRLRVTRPDHTLETLMTLDGTPFEDWAPAYSTCGKITTEDRPQLYGLAWNRDGSKYAYVAASAPAGPYRVVHDGRPGLEYETIRDLRMVDEKPFYVATQGRATFLVHGTREIRADDLQDLTISPDGKTFAYYQRTYGAGDDLFVNGDLVSRRVDSFQFTPSGGTLYVQRSEDPFSHEIVLDGARHGPFRAGELKHLTPSRDGSTFAMRILPPNEHQYRLVAGSREYVLEDARCVQIEFTDDGEHVACAAQPTGTDTSWQVFLDGNVIRGFDHVFTGPEDPRPFAEPQVTGTENPALVDTFRFNERGELTFLALVDAEIRRVTISP